MAGRLSQRTILVAVFVVLSLIWGTTWAAIRVQLEGIPPLAGVSLRFAIAGSLLLTLALIRRVPLGRAPHERWLWVANGLLSFCVSYGVTYWCEQWLPSGLASVLFATFPLFVVLLAPLLLPGDRLGRWTVLGTLVGFAGVAVIYSEDFDRLGGREVWIAALVMLLSPLAAALASVLVKRFGGAIHPLSLTAPPMLIAAFVMGGLSGLLERDETLTLALKPTLALLYLALFGSAVTFTGYFWLLKRVTASQAALIAYTTPVIAVATGALLLAEPVTWRVLVGAALVIAGVVFAARRS